ncbi:hypothetical protein NL676_032986 [Syzygium grande]|nr:hypothetical protein NL676_032986 [Syzygium grande]
MGCQQALCLWVTLATPKSSSDPSVTPLVVFSTLVAVCGSFATGCASVYSSPAESGIMEDLGLSTAAASPIMHTCYMSSVHC